MAQIQEYAIDATPENSDFLLGSGSDDSTKRFTLENLRTFFQDGLSGGASVNNYPETLTLSAAGLLTIERNGLSDLTASFGTAALKAESFFSAATHTHTVSDILSTNDITADYLNVSGNGSAGEYLVSDGDGSFSWAAALTANTNFYLDGISKNGNNLEFSVTGAPTSTITVTLGSAAYESTSYFAVAGHVHSLSELTGVGNLATLDKVSALEIKTDAVITSKIKDSQVTAAKLAISGNGTSGQVLASDGDGTFSWSTPTGQNYFLSNITKTTNTLNFVVSGGSTQSYTFGAAAFLDTGTTSSTVALGDHNHVAADITDLGAIATLDEITDDEIASNAVTTIKILDANITNAKMAVNSVDSDQYVDGSVDFVHLSDEFKTVATAVTLSSSTTTATSDFSTAAVFPITLASDATATTITYSNTTIGQTKILKVTGSGGTGTVTITGTKLGGTLDQTSSTVNYIQITAIGASEYIYTISQA